MKIICVLVTYNRIDKLKTALKSYVNQTTLPDKMIVVDNHSNDGTIEFLKEWCEINHGFEKELIFLPNNTGGSGGFYAGLKKALEYDSDWIYISDDDAYLDDDVIEKIKRYATSTDDNVGAICATVKENDGLGYYHRRVIKEGVLGIKEKNLPDTDYNRKCVELSTYSFVGTAIRTSSLWNIGLPNKDFFLWYDDIDIKKYVTIKYNLKSIVEGLITIIFVSIFNMEFSIIRWMISLIIMITYNWVFNRNTVVALGKKVMGKFARK